VLQEDDGAKIGAELVVSNGDSLKALDAGPPGEGSGDILDPVLTQGHPCQNQAYRSICRALCTEGREQQAPVSGHDLVKRTIFAV